MGKFFAFIKLKFRILFDIFENKRLFFPITMEQAIINSEIEKEKLIQFKLPISNEHTLKFDCGIKKYKEGYRIYDPNFGSVSLDLEEDVYSIFKNEHYQQDKLKVSESVLLETRKQLNHKLKNDSFNMDRYKILDTNQMLSSPIKENVIYLLDYWFNESQEELINNIEIILQNKNDDIIKYYIFLLEETLNYIHFEHLIEIYNRINKIYIEGRQKELDRIKHKLIYFIDWFSKS